MTLVRYGEDKDYNSIQTRRGDIIFIGNGFIMNLTKNRITRNPQPRLVKKLIDDSKVLKP